mgnify:CR=1 FL=1
MNLKLAVIPYKQDYYTIFCMIMCSIFLFTPLFINIKLNLIVPYLFLSILFNFIVNLINHNHSHVKTFNNKTLNRIFDFWLTINRGASAVFIELIHNVNHHKYEGAKEDWFSPENEGSGPVLLRPFVYVKNTVKRFRKEGKKYYDKMGCSFTKKKNEENIFLIVFIMSACIINLKSFIIFVVVPWYLGNNFLVLTNLIFHKNTDPSDKYNLSYNYTGKIENIVFLNGGYHTAHHLNPNVHWSELKKLHEKEIAPKINSKYIKDSMFTHFVEEYIKKAF